MAIMSQTETFYGLAWSVRYSIGSFFNHKIVVHFPYPAETKVGFIGVTLFFQISGSVFYNFFELICAPTCQLQVSNLECLQWAIFFERTFDP